MDAPDVFRCRVAVAPTAVVVVSVIAMVAPPCSAATLRVPSVYPTIQAGVDASSAGDTVLVAPGTYPENIVVRHTLALLSEKGPEVTTIDGQQLDLVIYVQAPALGTSIDGFRITHGYCWGNAAGIYVHENGGGALIRDNIIEYNHSSYGTGALYAKRSSTVEDNLIQYNNYLGSDGVSAVQVSGVFRRNVIRCNGAGTDLYMAVLTGEVFDNVVVENAGGRSTVDIWAPSRVRKNTIANNYPFDAAVTLQGNGVFEFSHNLVVDLDSSTSLRCLLESGLPHVIECNDVWGPGVLYGGDCSPYAGANGNFSEDPLFCRPNPYFCWPEPGDYRLSADSPCAAENSPPGCGLIGALPVGCGSTNVANQWTRAPKVRLTVIPNPVRSGATFTFDGIESPALEIYDPNGRLIDLLRPTGQSATWLPGSEVSSGVYFARLRGAGGARVVKFLVIR